MCLSVCAWSCVCLLLFISPQSPTMCTCTHNSCCSLAVQAQSRAPVWVQALPFHLPSNEEKLEETHPPLCAGRYGTSGTRERTRFLSMKHSSCCRTYLCMVCPHPLGVCVALDPIIYLSSSCLPTDTTLAWKKLLVMKRMQNGEQEPEGEPLADRAESERSSAIQDRDPATAIMFLLPQCPNRRNTLLGPSALVPLHLMC